jgi:hypothetical protein
VPSQPVDFERIFAEWRQQRRLDYETLAVLFSEGQDISENGSRMAQILESSLVVLRRMANYDCIRFMANGVTHVTLDEKYLEAFKPTPYRSQWDGDGSKFRSDCGPACVAMLLERAGKHISIDDVSIACGMGVSGKTTTNAWELIKGAGKYGLKLEGVSGWTLDQFSEHVPCIILVHYGSIPDRQDVNYTAGHWVVVTDVSGDVVFHDPNYRGDRREDGCYKRVPRAVFEQAVRDNRLDSNPTGYGVVVASG